jgi:rubrerythrin
MIDMTNSSAAGPSAWARELHAHLTSHVEIERGMLEEYRSVAEASSSKAFAYLVSLLIEDEMRHHRIFLELADSLETISLRPGADPQVPYLDFNRTNKEAVLDLTETLLEKEQQDALELKRLQRELSDVKDTSIWGLLVDLMQRDTQKHIAILKFVKKHTKRR